MSFHILFCSVHTIPQIKHTLESKSLRLTEAANFYVENLRFSSSLLYKITVNKVVPGNVDWNSADISRTVWILQSALSSFISTAS